MSETSHYDLDAIEKVFISFCGGFADYALEYRFGATYVLEVSKQEFSQIYGYEKLLDNFFRIIALYKTEIMNNAAENIAEYMNFFEIEPNDLVDEFKLIYFIGLRMAEIFEKQGLPLEAQIILFAIVVQLDERLMNVTNGKGRPELRVRLKKVIQKQEVKKRLGENGIYLIYKCAYRMLQKTTVDSGARTRTA